MLLRKQEKKINLTNMESTNRKKNHRSDHWSTQHDRQRDPHLLYWYHHHHHLHIFTHQSQQTNEQKKLIRWNNKKWSGEKNEILMDIDDCECVKSQQVNFCWLFYETHTHTHTLEQQWRQNLLKLNIMYFKQIIKFKQNLHRVNYF